MPKEAEMSSLVLKDLLTILYVLFLLFGLVLSNKLFVGFVASKPEGRKTAIGEMFKCTEMLMMLSLS